MVLILVSKISSERVTIFIGKVLADETALKAKRVDFYMLTNLLNCVASILDINANSAAQPNLLADTFNNAEQLVMFKQRLQFTR